MIDPKILREKLAEVCSQIPEIKRKEILVTDDEIVELASNHTKSDNILLIAVLPTYGGFGKEDEAGTISFMQFFLVEKTDYSFLRNQDEYLQVFQRTIDAVKKFMQAMFNIEILNCSREQLQYDFSIRPVSRKSQFNGYEIQIDSHAYSDLL